MPADEILPSGGLTPFGCRRDVVAPQDVAHRFIREVMAQVGPRAHDAVVTPARVLASEANHQLFQRGFYPGSARIGAASGTIELAGNQPPIPRQDGVRLGCAGHLLQSLASKSFSDLGQGTPLRIGELESGKCALRIRFSAARYSFCSNNS